MYDASSEIRNSAALAISSGCAGRPIGTWPPRFTTSVSGVSPGGNWLSGRATNTRSIGVSVGPRAHRVHPDLLARVTLRQPMHQAHHTELRDVVDRAELRSRQPRGRRGVQQRPAATRARLGLRRLRRHPARFEGSGPSQVQSPSSRDAPRSPRDPDGRHGSRRNKPHRCVGGAPDDLTCERHPAAGHGQRDRPAAALGNSLTTAFAPASSSSTTPTAAPSCAKPSRRRDP